MDIQSAIDLAIERMGFRPFSNKQVSNEGNVWSIVSFMFIVVLSQLLNCIKRPDHFFSFFILLLGPLHTQPSTILTK